MTQNSRPRLGLEAGAVGTSGGTGLVGLANLLPEQHAWLRPYLLYISPTFSIVVSVFWAYFASLVRGQINRWRLGRALTEARQSRDRICSDPNSTAAHKKNAKANVQRLETLQFEALHSEVAAFTARLKEVI